MTEETTFIVSFDIDDEDNICLGVFNSIEDYNNAEIPKTKEHRSFNYKNECLDIGGCSDVLEPFNSPYNGDSIDFIIYTTIAGEFLYLGKDLSNFEGWCGECSLIIKNTPLNKIVKYYDAENLCEECG